MSEKFAHLSENVNLVIVLDHVGRAGNGFLLGIFDQHPQVATSQWVHYIYSYVITEFGFAPVLDSRQACDFMTERSYFRFVFQDLDEKVAQHIYKIGGDPATAIDRRRCRETFERLVLVKPIITRRDLIVAAYYAMLDGMGRDVSAVKYILVADAVSLRAEHVTQGFSGGIMDAVLHDFPKMKAISLVRDPRAMFASNRHQFVNVLGNMYGIGPGNGWRRLKELWARDFQMYSTVWPFWLAYGAAAARCIYALRRTLRDHFRVLRNEDLNLYFIPTMQKMASWLEIDMYPLWLEEGYIPTSMGKPWKGTGAYNSRYQPNTSGLLENDSDNVAEKSAGPNAHVTTRWRSKLSPYEIRLIELLFKEELLELGYEQIVENRAGNASFLQCLIRPFNGELPSPQWVVRGFFGGFREGFNRLFYACVFPIYYIVARYVIFNMYVDGFFKNITCGEVVGRQSIFLSPVHRTER